MCRYAMAMYKPHYACFNCCKTFKRRLLVDIKGWASPKDESTPAKCPQCNNTMADMGLDFKSPKKNDAQAWKHLASLYKVGITFHSCGCTGPGYIPDHTDALVSYLTQVRSTYLKHQHFWARRKDHPVTQSDIARDKHKNLSFLSNIPNEAKTGTRKNPIYDTTKAQVYWGKKITELDQQIEYVKNIGN